MRPTLFLIILSFTPFVCWGNPVCRKTPGIASIQGHARVEWTRGKKIFRYDEAIVIQGPSYASFETLDDFGNTLLKMDFQDDVLILVKTPSRKGPITEKKFRKILSLPLSQKEFIRTLLYQVPEGVENLEEKCDAAGHLISVEKKAGKNGYKISFFDFGRAGRIVYPRTLEIVSQKTVLKILWKDLIIGEERR